MVAVFFYGLFMDAELLRAGGISVADATRARLDGYRLVLGQRATLVRDPVATAHGMLMHLEMPDVEKLYADASVSAYRPESVRVVLEHGKGVKALCFNLPPRTVAGAANRDYARKLHELGTRLALPADYLEAIRRVVDGDS